MSGSDRSGATGGGPASPRAATAGDRGVSPVVGVALLLAVTVLSLSVLTAGVGSLVESGADAAAADGAAAAFEDLGSASRTDGGRHRVPLGDGRLATVPRSVVVDNDTSRVVSLRADALVYEAGEARAAALAGGVTVGGRGEARFRHPPRVTAAADTVVVGLPVLVGDVGVGGGTGRSTVTLETTVVGSRRTVAGPGLALSVETVTPRPWASFLREQGATVDRRDRDGDGVTSVVARFETAERLHLVVYETRVEVAG
jgi:flagellin-like protein